MLVWCTHEGTYTPTNAVLTATQRTANHTQTGGCVLPTVKNFQTNGLVPLEAPNFPRRREIDGDSSDRQSGDLKPGPAPKKARKIGSDGTETRHDT